MTQALYDRVSNIQADEAAFARITALLTIMTFGAKRDLIPACSHAFLLSLCGPCVVSYLFVASGAHIRLLSLVVVDPFLELEKSIFLGFVVDMHKGFR